LAPRSLADAGLGTAGDRGGGNVRAGIRIRAKLPAAFSSNTGSFA